MGYTFKYERRLFQLLLLQICMLSHSSILCINLLCLITLKENTLLTSITYILIQAAINLTYCFFFSFKKRVFSNSFMITTPLKKITCL